MKKEFYMSLKFKLALVFTVLVGIVSLSQYMYFPQKFNDERMISLHEKANSVAKLAAYGISTGNYFEDKNGSQIEIETLIQNEEIRYIVIFKGDSIYYEYNLFTAVLSDYTDKEGVQVSEKWQILKSHAPIEIGDEKIGDIYVGYSLAQVNAKMQAMEDKIGIMSILLFIVGALLVYLVGYYFTRPLSQMVKTVHNISEGKLIKHAVILSKDEVGSLAKSFNIMVDKIALSNEEKENINKNLENRVKERTLEVENALKSLQKENEVRKKAEQKISDALKEKEAMLKEIHHRVKNNLQVVTSLLYFQGKQIKDPTMQEMFRDAQNRVKSMSLIHEKLYLSEDLANIDFNEYVKKLFNHLYQSYGLNKTKFKIVNNVKNIQLGVDTAVPCGLIINELISNSFQHGFKGLESGEITIDMGHDENNNFTLKVDDNGLGIPKDLNIEKTDSLGLRLVDNLATQLNGKIEILNDNGTTVKMVFEDPKYKIAS